VIRTKLTEMLGIKYPIIQAGMGPWSTDTLAVAVANAGALGIVSTVGMGYHFLPPTGLRDDPSWTSKSPYELMKFTLHWVGERTADKKGVLGVNIPMAQEYREVTEQLIRGVTDARKEDADLRERLKVMITSAGNPAPWTRMAKESGAYWFHVAPSVRHAQKAAHAGAEVVIASGEEGGGHVAFEPVHTMTLLPAVVHAVDVPVIGAGGFCDGSTLAAALSLGAIGVQMGTRFIATQESEFCQMWKDKVVGCNERDSMPGVSIFGPARYLRNQTALRLNELLRKGFESNYEEGLALETKGIMLSVKGEGPEEAVMFGGEVAGRINEIPKVEDLLHEISADAERIIRGLRELISE
jgi:NAD(P)H-dependent flavin oxidoreductase YrpB (nitropropane dioxygenase family)